MTYNLRTRGVYYDNEEKEKLEQLGFRFTQVSAVPDYILSDDCVWLKDREVIPTIKIDTLTQLMALVADFGEVLVCNDTITINKG